MATIRSISAVGTKGLAKGKLFLAKPDSKGRYVLNRKTSSPSAGNTTNRSSSKVYVATLGEAIALLETNEYLINLVSEDGKRALREWAKVKID